MTTNTLFLTLALAWPLASIITGLIIARAIRIADRCAEAERRAYIDAAIDTTIRRMLDQPDDNLR